MFKLVASTESGTVEILDEEIRELAANHLAGMAADATRVASGEASTTPSGKRRGRPPGSAKNNAATPPTPTISEGKSVDLGALAAGE